MRSRIDPNVRPSRLASLCVMLLASPDLLCAGATPPRNPEIKDYEIARYVYLKTSCGMRELTRLNPGGRPLRFHIECNNASNWPGGLDISCHEPDDDRTCTVTTREQHFKYLDLLRQRE